MRRLAAVLVCALALAGCRPVDGESQAYTVTAPTTVGERVELAPGLPWLTVDDHPKVSAKDKRLPPSETYNRRRDWAPSGWTDPDGNGCDTREDTLIRESLVKVECRRGRISGEGRWWRVYVEGQTANPGALEIDHVVSLHDSWRSGGWRWPVEKMQAYAQDPAVLMAVDKWANQDKSDYGPDRYQPTNTLVHCSFAQRYAGIKATYELTVTWDELRALRSLARSC